MIEDYYSVFEKRSHSHGQYFKQAVQRDAALNFKRFLRSSPDAIQVTVNDSNAVITVATILEKETETKNKRYFLCDKLDHVKVGDFIYWDSTVWLVFMKALDTIQAYDKFEALECKHTIKWIDEMGAYNESPAFLLGQTDEKVKANFRTWNNMITPQANAFLEIITSRRDIKLGQKFLFDNTAWHVVETDYLSVHNIIYLSLVEDKICEACDNTELDLANYVDLNKVVIEPLDENISLGVGDTYTFNNKIYLNGNEYASASLGIEVISGEDSVTLAGKELTAIAQGDAQVKLFVQEDEEVNTIVNVTVVENPSTNEQYVFDGDASIKWGRTKTYTVYQVVNGVSTPLEVTFAITDNENVLVGSSVAPMGLSLTANDDNKIGTVELTATLQNGEVLTKTVNIVSLWM